MNWILSRDGQTQFQKLTRENSLRIDIAKEGVVNPFYVLDPKREYLFTGLEEHKDKINEFRPWLEALVMKSNVLQHEYPFGGATPNSKRPLLVQ